MNNNQFNNKIIILDDVLTKVECENLVNYYNTVGPTHEWSGTFPMNINLQDKFLQKNIKKIEKSIDNFFDQKIKFDWGEIVKWPIGSHKHPHLDTASDKTIFTSVTYLNDDYDGGETYIVDDIKIIPKIGRTVFFDGNFYCHGVSKVEKNIRYTIPIWYKKVNWTDSIKSRFKL